MSDKIKGQKSYVLRGASTGGMITIRLAKTLHRRFAESCLADKRSMNAVLIDLINDYLGTDETLDENRIAAASCGLPPEEKSDTE